MILIAFLFEWRTALISLTALPLSLIAAALVIRYMGQTINTMVLAGLAIALGEVVDDAIIDVENIVRRLRLNRAAGNPESAFQVVLNASLEVRSAVVYASLIVGACLSSGLLSRRAGRLLLPASGFELRSGRAGLARRGAHGDAGTLLDAAAEQSAGAARVTSRARSEAWLQRDDRRVLWTIRASSVALR